jgi:hypothetical protein
VLRVVRIAKLGRFSPGLANFALTLRKSKKQMQMVAIVLLTGQHITMLYHRFINLLF